jgi:hypothetical protein
VTTRFHLARAAVRLLALDGSANDKSMLCAAWTIYFTVALLMFIFKRSENKLTKWTNYLSNYSLPISKENG